MKVVHVVRQFHPSVGGMEEVVLNIARRHLAAGGQAEVVTLDRIFHDGAQRLQAHEQHQGVPVRRLSYAGSTRYPLCPQVLGALHGADVVHVHGIDFFYDYLALTGAVHRKPMIVSTHGGFFHTAYASRLKRLWFNSITRASARAYRRIVATSRNDGEMFAPVTAAGRLRVIENGVDIGKFSGMGSPVPGKTLISFGRWSVNKGIPETLDLLGRLVAEDGAWRLILAGRAFDLKRADVERDIASRGLQAHVEVVEAPSQEQLGRLLSNAQYFVSLSRHEGFGIAAIEAMSAGLIPVLGDIPPYAKLHAESELGALVDAKAPEAAARAVRQLADADQETFEARRRKAMAYVARYDWDAVVDRYRDEYRQALAGTGGRTQ
ncbi:glycosyltransferase family 4 protein [Pseudoxanthomonas sacheonensis]|uniref:glycosyltransferase family 4 protein n=1 Tax=Pseudoxanthomonas sacheonensis TaxID=443615 RepID=UPI0013D04B35|nr:glycosyltransferase family 4 protein [Pseudoxanthomonas sacheonensis]KAF1708704.1 glycosyl transferase family 1 [Pseudoxanthomonas sacheonensis]